MRAAILAGGKGTRMLNLHPDIPKPMIPLLGKPLLLYQIDLLVKQGINRITLITGYKADTIRDYFGDGSAFGAQIDYIVEETPLGTGGALSLLPKEDTFILFGDVYLDVDLARFIRFHEDKQANVTLFAHPNSHPHDSDIVITDDTARVIAWASKKEPVRNEMRNLVNAGLYIFNREALPQGEAVRRDLEHDVILPMLVNGKVLAYRSTEYVKDMGTPERLESVTYDIESGMTAARRLDKKQRAIFLDRDGTLNKEGGFVTKPEQIELLPGVEESVRLLNKSPFLTICITNQPVIARGDVDFTGLEAIHARLDTLLGLEGAYLDDLIFCPHHPDKGFSGEMPEYKLVCDCRKPEPGMLIVAAKRYNIDLSRSYMVGDSTADIAAGKAAGCRTVGLKTGIALTDDKYKAVPDVVCEDLLVAVKLILRESVK